MSEPPARSSPDPYVPEKPIDAFARHVMGLMLIAPRDDHDTPQHSLYSGVLLRFRGLSLWMTAGHVLDEINEALTAFPGRVKGGWHDDYLYTDASAIPVPLESLNSFSLHSIGIDVGLIFLDTYASALIANNPRREFLDEADLANASEFRPDLYFLVGFPRDHVRLVTYNNQDGRGSLHIRSGLTCLRVSELKPHHSWTDAFWQHDDGFYGRLEQWNCAKKRIGTIRGMSGGPLFGVQFKKNRLDYMLCGIQSAWLRSDGTVRAVTIDSISRILHEVHRCCTQRILRECE